MKPIWQKNMVEIVHVPRRQGNIRNSRSSISTISEEMGYEPQYTLAEGLQALFKSL
jgi:hypothetical protein